VTRRATAPAAALILAALALVGCGGGSSTSSTTPTTTKTTATLPAPKPPPNAEEGTVFVSLGSVTGLGEVLVDSEGHTLYAFSGDAGEAPTCEGACAKAWPPLLDENGEPQPSNGNGQSAFGGTWTVLKGSGVPAK
jgi:hypothetical protein